MEHTYLVKSGKWKIDGVYNKLDNTSTEIKGTIEINRDDTKWDMEIKLWDISCDTRLELELTSYTVYEIEKTQNPLEYSVDVFHNVLGILKGKITVVPMIITMSCTGDKDLSLSQMALMINENEYKIQSVRNKNGNPIDWWEGTIINECD